MNNTYTLLKNNFSLESNYLRYAIRLTISCALAVTLYKLLKLPNGYWTAFSVITCVLPTVGQSLKRSKHRLIGTFIGMWFGIIIAHLFGYYPFLIDIILPIVIFFCFYTKPFNYALYALLMTIITVLYICFLIPGDWEIAIIRLTWTILGIALGLFATLYIFPSEAQRLLPAQLKQVMQSLNHYYDLTINRFNQPTSPYIRTKLTNSFEQLQSLFNIWDEYRVETRYLGNFNAPLPDVDKVLTHIYQQLLLLDLHIPTQINTPSLQPLCIPLDKLLHQISTLFTTQDEENTTNAAQELTHLLDEIKRQRITATHDITIPSASLMEHIQLTLFIESLQNLLTNLIKLTIPKVTT